MKLSVCIATYRRSDRLEELLADLAQQRRLPDQVVIVDNDAEGSARFAVARAREAALPFTIDYDIQPERNIALTRNRTVQLADGDWLAFIDDDERAPADWLSRLLDAAEQHAADGVLGPVEPKVPADAPAWIRRGRFYDFPRLRTGEVVPLNRMRFGNILLNGTAVRSEPGPFDASYGLSTGEDGDLLVRLAHKGHTIIWCDEAEVWEPVERKRLSLRWLSIRALSGGQEYARQTIRGKYRPITRIGKAMFYTRAFAQALVAAALSLALLPAGRHLSARWWITLYANLGKLSVILGSRHRPYA